MPHQWSYVKLLNAWGPWAGNDGGFRIMWACEIGIGELTFYNDKDGVLHYDSNEYLDDEFCEELLVEFFRRAKPPQRP